MASVIFSPTAEADLLAIWSYIAQHSRTNADKFFDSVNEKCQLLAANSAMGRLRPELGEEVRSFPIGNYVIYYWPVSAGVEIVRILHTARDLSSIWHS